MQSQMFPMNGNGISSSSSSSSSLSGIVHGSKSISSTDNANDDMFDRNVDDFMSDEDVEPSDSGSYSMETGSGSSSLEYGCDCRSVRRVSLMGASDYCLAPNAPLSSKCGNVDLAESGACPIVGAQPCSAKGHVLANDSFCELDDKDETYKCVASKDDLEIQKNGKKRKKNSKRNHGRESSTSTASSHLLLTAREVVAIVVCVAVGVMAVV
ncbi:unnamed protein product [Peronospora belbahrii]|uniref:Uncharacterized protein n=1 Tax=Peronospora belbahrii TaxID=622444 RepID=A0AAU9L0A2_9STRA|nr:unnamed protein product [Peronospora belbahrii]CAH0514371.1 unnamed protein product [Peronospora belbahrii]